MHRARAAQDGRYAGGRGGATVHELMASFDWRTPGQAKVYTDAAAASGLPGRGWGCSMRIGTRTRIVVPKIQAVSHLKKIQDLTPPGGRSGGTRTPNPRFWRPVLWPIELHS